jgi:hypothetical protein
MPSVGWLPARGRDAVGQIRAKKRLIFSQIGTLAGPVLLASANGLVLVFLARIIDGLTSGNISVAHALQPSTARQRPQGRSARRAVRSEPSFGRALRDFSFNSASCPGMGAAALSRSAPCHSTLLPRTARTEGCGHGHNPEPETGGFCWDTVAWKLGVVFAYASFINMLVRAY